MPLKSRTKNVNIDLDINSDELSNDLIVTLPKKNIQVCLKRPSVQSLIDVEESSKDAGQFEQSLILLSKLITKYGTLNSVSIGTLSNLSLEDIRELNESFSVGEVTLEHDITSTPSGNEAIVFNLSDGREVTMIRPNGLHMLEVEREINKKYKNSGELRNMVVLIARLIVKYGEVEGEKCISSHDLLQLSLQDWGLIVAASSIFFRP